MKITTASNKKNRMTEGIRNSLALLIIAVILSVAFFFSARGALFSSERSCEVEIPTYMSDGEIVLADNGQTDLSCILYGTAPHASIAKAAVEISDILYSRCKVDVPYKSYSASSPKTNVIVYGRVDLEPSLKLADEIDALGGSVYAWGIAYENGVLALYANSKLALSEDSDVFADLFDAFYEYIEDGKLSVPDDLYRVFSITDEDYQRLLEEKALAERDDRIDALKEAIGAFTEKDFDPDGLGITTDLAREAGFDYGSPYAYPTANEHPRVLFTKNDIPGIIAALEDPDNETAYKDFREKVEVSYTGVLGEPTDRTSKKGNHNYDYTGLAIIQAKAFAYAIYGDEEIGYQAIYAMLNYIKTLEVNWMYLDLYREYGWVMYTAACVYDWCYDLLTEEAKANFVLGIEHQICRGTANQPSLCSSNGVKMEIGFPPTKQSAVSGHGCEQQLLRDYLSFAIAIFDEYSGWYEFIGGRFYNQFVEPRNTYYASSCYPQGTSYNAMRFQFDLYSAALIKSACGKMPYSDDIRDAFYGMFSHVTDVSSLDYYKVGDVRTSTVKIASNLGPCALILSHLYSDGALRSIASLFPGGYTTFSAGVDSVTAVEFTVWSSSGVKKDDGYLDELPLITYYGGFISQIISRNIWHGDCAVVLMKIQQRTTANHDHAAAGNFQIYYKGILTGDIGDYGGTSYGSDHCKYFLRATVSHNGLLIYNTNLKDTQSGYYTGGQRVNIGEAGSFDAWQSSNYDTATLTGYSYGYDQSGEASYSYIAGNLTAAYDPETVDYVGRSMLTVYTDDTAYPMIFFVFDRIDAKSADYKKTFLLQVPTESAPEIDNDGKTVTISNGEGKLKLYSLIGGDSIVGLGGTADDGSRLNYQINGSQLSFVENGEIKDGSTWGRVEISVATGSKSDRFLNVITVSDAENEITLNPTVASAKNANGEIVLEGASAASITALFTNDTKRITDELYISNESDGLTEYYIGGLYTGSWTVKLNGAALGTVYSTNDSGFVHFTLPKGEITLTPGNDIRPANSGTINYITNGGKFDKTPLEFYPLGVESELPTNISRGTDRFAGWYADADLTEPVSSIPADAGDSFTVYARWIKYFVNEDYSETSIKGPGKVNGIQYAAGSNSGVSITDYKYQTDGESALIWSAPIAGTHIYKSAEVMENSVFTYEFELAKNGENTPLNVAFRFRESVKSVVHFLYITEDGEVLSGNKSFKIFDLTEKMQAVRIVVDFEEGLFIYYTDGEDPIYTQDFSLPKDSTAQSTLEFQGRLEQFFNIYGSGTERRFDEDMPSIKIGKITLADGNTLKRDEGGEVNANKIVYNTNGGIFTTKPNPVYTPGEKKALATNITNGGNYFAGWYTDESFTNRITEIPEDASGEFAVYAKWITAFISEDYSTTTINGATTKGNISYAAGKNGDTPNTNYTFKTDGEGALIFGATTTGSYIKANPQSYTSDAFTFELELAKNGNNTPLTASFRTREGSAGNKSLYLFYVKPDGFVYANDTKTALFSLDEEMTRLIVTVDFASGMIHYSVDGEAVLSLGFSVPAGSSAATTKEWQSKLDQLFNFVTGTTEPQSEEDYPSIRIGCINVYDGALIDPTVMPEPEPEVKDKIVYNTDGGEFAEEPETDYVRGERTPLNNDITKDGYYFIGWYSDKALLTPVSELPEDAEGVFEVYAKWFKVAEYKNLCNVTSLKTINIHECSSHTLQNSDEKGVCLSCGYCTEANAASCPFYTKPSVASTCTICGKGFKKSSTLGVLSGNDGALGYAKTINLSEESSPILTVVSRNGTHLTVNESLYGALYDESGTAILTKLVIDIELGIPTSEQAESIISGTSFTELPNATVPMNIGLRLGKSGYYSDMLFRVVNGYITFTSSADDAIAQLPVGSTASYRIELDFSAAIAGDGAADNITVSIYGEDGALIGSADKATATGHDISEYTETLFQLRAESGGAIMIDNVHAYTE